MRDGHRLRSSKRPRRSSGSRAEGCYCHRVSDFDRTVRDWESLYEDGLGAEDRHALEERDITAARIEAMKSLATADNPASLRRLLIELRAIEMRMSEPPRTAAYR